MSNEGVSKEMPRYKSHKVIHALKIDAIQFNKDGSAVFKPVEPGYASVYLSAEYVQKHDPQVGGYYVVYKDGYKSWSPANALEGGYTRI